MQPRTLERTVGGLSMAAGAIHGIVAPAHLEEWWGYGLFFLAAAAFQVLFGVALITGAINPLEFGPGAERARRILFATGLVVNVAILALYVVTRTSGIPWFGPEAGETEDVGVLDSAASLVEIAVATLLALLFRRTRRVGATPESS